VLEFRRNRHRPSRAVGVSCLLVACAIVAGCGGGGGSRVADADRDSVADAQDCAPNDPTASRLLAFQSEDKDSDGHFVNATGEVCAGSALPPKYASTPVAGSADCDDANATRWQLLAYVARDADIDGHNIASAGQVCSGTNLPSGYFAVAAVPPEDCNDADSSMWRLMTVWTDADGDAVGAGRGTVSCVGNAAAAGFSLLGYDPLDDPANPSSPGTSTVELAAWQLTPRL
jgi:hypothetical protein